MNPLACCQTSPELEVLRELEEEGRGVYVETREEALERVRESGELGGVRESGELGGVRESGELGGE